MSHLTPPSDSDGNRLPKACVTCAHAKVKCEVDEGQSICKRCQRLKKVCTGQVPGSHRRTIRKSSDVARLEQKLDGVAAILASSGRQGGRHTQIPMAPSRPPLLSPTTHVEQVIKTNDEAVLILNTFRDEMAIYFPFVVVPANMTVGELKSSKPFLFLVIMTIACRHDASRQSTLATTVREFISQKMIIQGEQSLDLLQGLLVYLAWYHIHFHLGSQLGNLAHLVMALISDLGLNRNCPHKLKPVLGTVGYFHPPDRPPPARTLEERRAFLGSIYATTVISMSSRDIDPVRFSSYADECCRVLEETAEHPSDKQLVQMVQIIRMAIKISRTLTQEEWDLSAGISAPIGACVKSLEADLHRLRSCLADGSHCADILSLHYHLVEIFLYEIAVHDNVGSPAYSDFPMTRLTMLFACLNSTKTFFEKWYCLPTSTYFNFPYLVWTMMGHASVILSKLCLITSDGWDANYARSTFNFSAVVDTMVAKMNEAKANATILPIQVPECFQNFTAKLQHMKDLHMYKAAQLMPEKAMAPSITGVETLPPMAVDDEFIFQGENCLLDFLDDSLWPQFP